MADHRECVRSLARAWSFVTATRACVPQSLQIALDSKSAQPGDAVRRWPARLRGVLRGAHTIFPGRVSLQFPTRLRRTPSDETSSVSGPRAILKRRRRERARAHGASRGSCGGVRSSPGGAKEERKRATAVVLFRPCGAYIDFCLLTHGLRRGLWCFRAYGAPEECDGKYRPYGARASHTAIPTAYAVGYGAFAPTALRKNAMECFAPTGLGPLTRPYPRLTPWATGLSRLRRSGRMR